MPREMCDDCHDILCEMEDEEKAEVAGCLLADVDLTTELVRSFSKSLTRRQLVDLITQLVIMWPLRREDFTKPAT